MDNYQFIKQIGQGSYSDVWLVKCSKTRKKHVLKRIDVQQMSKREQRAAQLEAKLLSTIKHPNIVTYLDSFHNSSGSLFIVMGYCENGDLYSFIKSQNGKQFEEKQVVHWFVQICLALKYLHDRNILHRDLKTRNIFVTKNKLIKVGDFGIAKVLSATREMATTLIGTPFYLSPEVFAGQPYNQKSDIWALGCVTYEIATLKYAFVAQDLHFLIKNVMSGKLPPMPEYYSPELSQMISSMLLRNPDKRPCVTELLLNDYIRKYILIFLRESMPSPDAKSESDIQERSKSSSFLPQPVNAVSNAVSLRSKSSSSLPLHNKTVENKKVHSKLPRKNAKSIVTLVPDVNGNGDGNDNSQQRRSNFSHAKNPNESTENSIVSPKFVRETLSDAKMSSCNTSYSDMRQNASEAKAKGEKSFEILNNLTYSVHNTRNKSCGCYSDDDSMHESKCLLDAYLSENSSSKFSWLLKGNVHKNNEMCEVSKQSNVCMLPKILNASKNEEKAAKCNARNKLPLVKVSP